jgi:uncharacterized protein (DUF1501 family)
MTTRRQFLKTALITTGLGLTWKAWATPNSNQNQSKLLVIMLRGAYDGASLLIPHNNSFYYASRPNIAIPKPNSSDLMTTLDIGNGYGLHPSFNNSLYPFYQAKQVTFIPFSGSQDISRSHFQSQDVMELGQNPTYKNGLDYSSGFLNRLVSTLRQGQQTTNGISFTQNSTPIFHGNINIPNISLQTATNNLTDKRQINMIEKLYQGQPLNNYVLEGISTRQEVSNLIDKEMKDSARGAQHVNGFEKTARTIGDLMRNNPSYSIGFVDVGGWDTHVNQGSSTGTLATNFSNLGNALVGFSESIGNETWKNTTVIIMSEFGRTFHENGNHGTDHGHGNTMILLGGSIVGGKISGEMIDINPNTLFQNRDLPIINDYRAVISNILARMYGLNKEQLNTIFPGVNQQNFDVI